MIFKYIIDEVAGAQLLEAAAWYEEKRAGLGNDLILCFEEGIETIWHSPFLEERYRHLRLFNIKRFPYQIIYSVENDLVTVVAFFHAHRNPTVWKK